MTNGIKLFSDIKTRKTILELWGASTKHYDSRFKYNREDELPKGWDTTESTEEELYGLDAIFIYGWLLKCASSLTWYFYQRQLVDFANEYYEQVLR